MINPVPQRLGGDASALLLRGLDLARTGQSAEALRLAAEGLAAQPDDAVTQHRAGVVAKLCGRPDDALQRFLRAIELLPGFHFSLLEIGHIHAERDDLSEALRWYRNALVAEPGYPVSSYLVAQMERRLGRPEEACAVLDAAHACDPADAMIVGELAATLIALRRDADLAALQSHLPRDSETLARFDAVLETILSDSDAAGWVCALVSDIRVRQGRVSEALAAIERAVAVAPGEAVYEAKRRALRGRLGFPEVPAISETPLVPEVIAEGGEGAVAKSDANVAPARQAPAPRKGGWLSFLGW